MVNILSEGSSVVNQFIAELRDAEIQKDSLRFRLNLERLGEIFAYEISKTLEYEEKEVATQLGSALVPVLKDYPVLVSVMRAGLPFHSGFLKVFDRSESGFISAYRRPHKDFSLTLQAGYSSIPVLDGHVLILSDTLVATGSSMLMAYRELQGHGKPRHVHVATILTSQEGLDKIRRHLPGDNITYWVGVIDEELTAQSFIVPGLGDAGDLAYGRIG
ncbi:MAG TPA: uracil phosphoribosyltransferase [Bacteroidales bacterium]|nr:uracil phosphoribosyltransferase [Bacteroidales bacterium]